MSAISKARSYTFEDFCFLVKDGEKADLIDGLIYTASPDNTDANELMVWLLGIINLFVLNRDLGKVYASRVAYRLDDRNGPEPDIGFVRKRRRHLIKRGHVADRPDLALEIVSPESEERDYKLKRAQFERAEVPEYWIVDEMRQKISLLRLGPDKKYHEVRPRGGVLRSQVLSGFWLRVDWLWQKPLPNPLDVLKEILEGRST
jgi:Uma2 family endonuclease